MVAFGDLAWQTLWCAQTPGGRYHRLVHTQAIPHLRLGEHSLTCNSSPRLLSRPIWNSYSNTHCTHRTSDMKQASGSKPEQYFNEPVNTNFIKNPLRLMDNLKFDDWWFHGVKGATPNSVMELPAGCVSTFLSSQTILHWFLRYPRLLHLYRIIRFLPCVQSRLFCTYLTTKQRPNHDWTLLQQSLDFIWSSQRTEGVYWKHALRYVSFVSPFLLPSSSLAITCTWLTLYASSLWHFLL